MARLSKEESRQRWSEVRRLLNEWDPIGVIGGPDSPNDEYDWLAGPLLRLMERDASSSEISDFLRTEIEDHFGLDPRHYDFDGIAERLKGWFRERWAGSFV
jgi:hypothetical protein